MGSSSESNGTTQIDIGYDFNTSPLGFPITITCWINTDTTSGAHSAVGIYDNIFSGTADMLVGINGDKVACAQRTTYATGSTVISTGTWYFICAVFRSDSDREVYLNGVSDAADTTAATALNKNILVLYTDDAANFHRKWDGKIAWPTAHSVELTTKEMQELMYKPGSVVRGLECAPFVLGDHSTLSTFKDLGPYKITPGSNKSNLPSISYESPPVHFPRNK